MPTLSGRRCLDPTEFGTNVSGVCCGKCKFGHCLPLDPTDLASPWRCDRCQEDTVADTVLDKVKFCILICSCHTG